MISLGLAALGALACTRIWWWYSNRENIACCCFCDVFLVANAIYTRICTLPSGSLPFGLQPLHNVIGEAEHSAAELVEVLAR